MALRDARRNLALLCCRWLSPPSPAGRAREGEWVAESVLGRSVVAPLDLEFVDLAGEGVAAHAEQMRGLDAASAGVGKRLQDERALELPGHLGHDALLA